MHVIRTLARTVRAPTVLSLTARRRISSHAIPAASAQPKIIDVSGKFNPNATTIEVDDHIKVFGDNSKNGPIWRAAALRSNEKSNEKERDIERHNREFRERAGRSG
ncbi:hypothetical protein Dda_1876 [Drechslerella dactyloides]|uniref:Uncharacterized protein n=1 Tax=Drechslerella dactyloides TaxID=74499 RepID=A0AAD6J2Q4_DREDA|nr:hypothetical protein Dda_1876 [Drechslerella dactyloides]